jgi:hypothetical protein
VAVDEVSQTSEKVGGVVAAHTDAEIVSFSATVRPLTTLPRANCPLIETALVALTPDWVSSDVSVTVPE